MDKVKIGITGSGSLFGQAIIKSIKNSIWNEKAFLVGFDYFADTVGSLWVDKNFLLPDFLKADTNEKDWLGELIDIIKAEKAGKASK